jgi:selenocysteine lyase/cysteine desulfurase
MPELPPERYESGTLSTPAIAGLLRGVEAISAVGLSHIAQHEKNLFCAVRNRLSLFDRITIHVPRYQGSTLLFSAEGVPSEKLASSLGKKGICVRGGYHCSALGHQTLKTPEDGAVRVSFGMFNKTEDVDLLYSSIRSILREV